MFGLVLLAVVMATGVPRIALAEVILDQRVESLQGAPETLDFYFDGAGYEDTKIVLTNGNPDGTKRISSAVISLNLATIIKPSDFNQNVAIIRRDIAPLDGTNKLSVSLRSNPGGFLTVQVHGEPVLNLPPDPGPAGSATLGGVDVNGNGVRDDIERWIGLTFRGSEKSRQALTQSYYAVQALVNFGSVGNRDQVHNNMTAFQRAGECLDYVRPDDAVDVMRRLRAQILNTSARTNAYLQASRLLGGGSFPGKPMSQWKESCSFDPDQMPN